MIDFKKNSCIGIKATEWGENYPVYVMIQFKEGNLSIQGVEGPSGNGNCKGSCGQIIDELKDCSWTFSQGWDKDSLTRFVSIWDQYHLNDMKAGTPKQLECLKGMNRANLTDYYYESCKYLEERKLLFDLDENSGHMHKYGHGWLRIEVPEAELEFLNSLPDATLPMAWNR